MVVSVMFLSTFTSSTRNSNIILHELPKYFKCEFAGHDPLNPCDRSVIEGFESDGATILKFFVGGYPIVFLIFVFNVQDLRKRFKSLCDKVRTPCTNSRAAELSHYHRYGHRNISILTTDI
jgi:hypothetical protein